MGEKERLFPEMITATIFLIIIVLLYWLGRDSKDKKISIQQPIIVNSTIYERLGEDEFQTILANYRDSIYSTRIKAQEIEKLAEDFELRFNLRSLFNFFFFIQQNTNKYSDTADIKKWWANELIDSAKIKFKENGNLTIILALDKFDVSYTYNRKTHYDEFQIDPRHDPTYYDIDREIVIKNKEEVYKISGSDYRQDYLPPPIPEYMHTYIFKPDKWLLKVHNYMIDFNKHKPQMERRIEDIKSENSLKRARERFSS